MVTEAVEIERKYDVDGPIELPLAELPGLTVQGPRRHVLDAAYFDTSDLRLIRAKVTLRRRTGGDDAGWHLKLPAGGPGERVELRLPPGRGAAAVPGELVDLTLSRTRGAPLARVATLRTERQQWRLLDGDTAVAEVVADSVRAQRVQGGTLEWTELEVEVLDGRRELLDELEPRLLDAGARPSASSSKLGRVLADAEPDPQTRYAGGSAGAVVLDYLRAQVEALVANDPKVRRDVPDSIHQMRVAARRARSTLQSFRKFLDRSRTEPVVEELRWLGRVLSGAREAEVQRERLLAGLRELPVELVVGPVVSRVDSHLLASYAAARESALTELRGQRYLQLLDDLQRLLADPPFTARAHEPAGTVLPALVARAQRRVRRAYARWVDSADREADRDTALHEMRKAAKRARYAVDTVAAVAGKPASRSAKRLKRVQSLLGDHQDVVVSGRLLRQLAGSQQGEGGFSYGILLGRDLAEAARLRAELPDAWQRADRRKTRRWMK